MLSVWWDMEGIVYWELKERKNKCIDAAIYCDQLEQAAEQIRIKRPYDIPSDILYLHDNARPHTASVTKKTLSKIGWETLSHPPYSPDMAPSDRYLFRSLSNALRGKEFKSLEQAKAFIEEFFDSKSSTFFQRGINQLPDWWSEIIENEGEYDPTC
jgi:transposase